MRPKTGLIVAIVALALPTVAVAQHVGFNVGVASPVAPWGFAPTPAHGAGLQNPYTYNPYTNSIQSANPYTGAIPGYPVVGYIVPTVPHGPTGTVIGPGASIFVQGHKVAPPHTPTHPTPAPVVIRGNGRRDTNVPTHPVATPNPNGTFVNGNKGNRGNSHNVQSPAFLVGGGNSRGNDVNLAGGLTIGKTRDQVIAQYGQPTVAIADANGEALVFGGVTFLIQNGVVTRIYQR